MADVSFETSLIETSRKANGYEVMIIEAGQYDGKMYPAHVLERAAPLFEGIQAFIDRPTSKERRERPERSIKDLVGLYEGTYAENGKIRATLKLIEGNEWLEEIIERRPESIGIRINADGRTSRDYSKSIDIVESIDSVFSADIVTSLVRTGRILEASKTSEPLTKEVKKMKYHIGTLLPEAVRAYVDLYGLRESETVQVYVESQDGSLSLRQESGKGKAYHIGTLIPEAKRAWVDLNLREGR